MIVSSIFDKGFWSLLIVVCVLWLLVCVVFEVAKMKPPFKRIIGFAFTRQLMSHVADSSGQPLAILEDDNPFAFLHEQGLRYRDGGSDGRVDARRKAERKAAAAEGGPRGTT